MLRHYAQLAQLVEQRTENPCVSGSIPELGIEKKIRYYGILAQLVEHLTFNQVVGGSNPPCLTGRSIVVCYRSFFMLRSIRTVYFYGIWYCSTTSI